MGHKTHIACIVGTRPEFIKMVPVIFALRASSWAKVSLIDTAQHRGLLDDMFDIFDLKPDFDLNIMTENQTLGHLTGNLCHKLDDFLTTNHFDTILAVGDTTTVLVASLIGFYHKIPFGHIEAGMRTYDKYQPFPEEIDRTLDAALATWHFAPTELEKQNLLRENIHRDAIFVTGNPVVDALYWVLQNKPGNPIYDVYKRIIIVTAHRRENHAAINDICQAILILAERFKDIDFMLPVHPNPNVHQIIMRALAHQPNILLLPPLKYDTFAHLMQRSLLILTDSGGMQEEAGALHKPIIVMRNVTERPAIIQAGIGLLVGTETENIVKTVSELLNNSEKYKKMSSVGSPYGDGHAAEYIVNILEKIFKTSYS